ncbi:MAG TPA: hypothetical protein PK529_14260 [Verrucomicrobiales bacterium]|nr:hypothetical protein [Verrucomicrobiales bacterium]
MELYKLTLVSILTRKTFAIFAILLIALPFALPLMTPWESKPSLLEPARAQMAWGLLWAIGIGWLLFQGATIGDRWSSHGILEYFKTLGFSKRRQMVQMWLSCFTVFGGMILIAFIISTFTAMPGDAIEAHHWLITNLQYLMLFIIVMAPLLILSISLGTRFNGAAAYAISIGLALYGLFGIGYLEVFLVDNKNIVLNLLYLVSPHYHLSDLTSRLVFKLGSVPWGELGRIATYLGGIGLVTVGFSYQLYKEGK